jgi:hypothetical protein
MAAMTLPFTGFCVARGRIPLDKVALLYAVFWLSVWLYHMTGLVAGMIADKPRRASWSARMLILVLYLFLPRMLHLGFTFLGFLTFLPAFDEILGPELRWAATDLPLRFQEVGFFTFVIPPTLYTFFVQGLLLVALFTIVRRKWQQQTLHAFSKRTALIFFGGLQVLVLGSLWPFLGQQGVLRFVQGGRFSVEAQWLVVLYAFFFIAGLACLLLVGVVTPRWETFVKGLRRARKKRQLRLPLLSDESPGLLTTLLFALITAVSYGLLFGLALPAEGLHWNPSVANHLVVVAIFTGLLYQVQVTGALWGSRGILLLVGGVWLLPAAVGAVLVMAWSATVPAGYLASPTPLAAFFYALLNLFSPVASREPELQPIIAHLPGLLTVSVACILGLPLGLHGWLRFRQRRARREVFGGGVDAVEAERVSAVLAEGQVELDRKTLLADLVRRTSPPEQPK